MSDTVTPSAAGRIASVDTVRVLAITAVIAIHTTPFQHPGAPIGSAWDSATLLNQAARFAVPFFYVVSGYFWAGKFADDRQAAAPTLAMLRKLLIAWLSWSAIYLLPVDVFGALTLGALGPVKALYWNLAQAWDRPLLTLLEGTKSHLWFLVGLMGSAAVSAVFVRRQWQRALAVLAVALYAFGLAGVSHPDAPFGIALDPSFRNGHFFALAFFVTGYALQRRGLPAGAWRTGLALAAAGFALHLAEVAWGHRLYGTPLERDYTAGTYLFGVGVAVVALASPRGLGRPAFASLGPSVRGIYLSHMVFVGLLHPLQVRWAGHAAWSVGYVAAVFALSYGLTRLLARHAWTQPLVS